MFCQNCRKQIPENVKFCTYCGVSQINSSSRSDQQKTPSYTTQQQQSYVQTDEKALKKYITPYISRNVFIVLAVINIMFFALQPIIGLFFAVYTIPCGIAWAYGLSKTKKLISQMQSNSTYEEILREFSSSASLLNDKIRYSENYIFGKGSGCFFNYQTILWVYQYRLSYFFIPILSHAKIGDSKGKLFSLGRLKSGNKEIKALATLIYNKNPQVILGFDAEREKAFRERTRQIS